MAHNYIFCLCFGFVLGTVGADIQVNISNVWQPDFGWQVSCSWDLPSNDSLQSVDLYGNNQKIFTYKPENGGNRIHLMLTSPDHTLTFDCTSTEQGVTGSCLLNIELLQPQQGSFQIACSVQGVYDEVREVTVVNAFVPPTNTLVENELLDEQTREMKLNCTASSLLRPNLTWTIADQEVPQKSAGGAWNSTSKLWNVWSVLNFTPSEERGAVCTPEIRTEKFVVKGQIARSAPWNLIKTMKVVIPDYYSQGPTPILGCGPILLTPN